MEESTSRQLRLVCVVYASALVPLALVSLLHAKKKIPDWVLVVYGGAFAVLLVWCVGQNVCVEMCLYHDQLAAGKALSWAPLAPTGPWWNPALFEFRDRTISFQGQAP